MLIAIKLFNFLLSLLLCSFFQIKEHYEQFQEYDANNDHTLDFVEMLQAIRGTVGDYFKPRQIKVSCCLGVKNLHESRTHIF